MFFIGMIKLIYNIKGDLPSSVKKSLLSSIEEDLDEINYKEEAENQHREDTDKTQIFKLFNDLI